MPIRFTTLLMILALAAFGAACGNDAPDKSAIAAEAGDALRDVEAGAERLAENVEDSARVYDETYDAERERGENAIEAGGAAYEAVLETPEEEEKKKSR